MIIKEFRGQYRFLSNFYFSSFRLGEYPIIYLTVEHYYQSQKAARQLDCIRIINCKTPGDAKRMGRTVKLISVWDEVKDLVMKKGIKAKFHQNRRLLDLLLGTGDYLLIEGNYWHDNYWGDCYCPKCLRMEGRNELGKILMEVRKEGRE